MTSGRPGAEPDPRRAEQAYEADARRWLSAYPPRWRRAREEEVLGVLLDTRPSGADRLSLRSRSDLLRGALAYRSRTHPPPVRWWLWRWCDVRPGPPYEDWTVDDVSGRFFALRRTWLGWVGFFAVSMTVVVSDLGREPTVWAWLPLVVCLVLSLLPEPWRRRRLLTEVAARTDDDRLARGFDRSVPWSYRYRYAWSARVMLPVGGLVAGTTVAVAVVVAWWVDPTARALTQAVPMLPLQRRDLFLAVLPLLPLGCLVTLPPLAVLGLAPRRARTRPPQPWRGPPRPLPLPLVVPLAVVVGLLPVGAAALPAVALALPSGGETAPGSPTADLLATAAGASGVLLLLLVAVLVVAAGLLVCWVRLVRTVAAVPEPALALVDVLDVRSGDRVAVDSPVLLRRHGWAEYPAPPRQPR